MQVQRTQQNQWFLAFQVFAIPCYHVHLLKLLLLILASQGGNFFITHVYLLLIDYFS